MKPVLCVDLQRPKGELSNAKESLNRTAMTIPNLSMPTTCNLRIKA